MDIMVDKKELNIEAVHKMISHALSDIKSLQDLTEKDKWKNRLLSLDENKQKQIASKYYGGHMPWKK